MSNGDDDSAAAHGEHLRTWRQSLAAAIARLRVRWHEVALAWLQRHKLLLEFLLATLFAAVAATQAHVPDSPTTPGGMLAIELPGTRSGALAMLALLREGDHAPDAIGTREVTQALQFDFAFIVLYLVALLLATEWAIRLRFDRWSGPTPAPQRQLVDRFAAKAPYVAAALDCIENLGLLALIHLTEYKGVGLLASATTLAALCKWTTLVFLALYLARLLAVIWWRWVLAGRARQHTPH